MLPIIGLALQYAPDLIGLFVGQKAADATDKVIAVAKEIFGTDEPKDIAAQIAADESKARIFAERLKAETDALRIAAEDTASAREQTIKLVDLGSSMAWGAPVVSVLVTLAFIGDLAALFIAKVNLNEMTGQVLLLLTGTLSAAFTQVVNYWLGSSAGSASKDVSIRQALATPAAPVKKAK